MDSPFILPPRMVAVLGEELTLSLVQDAALIALRVNARGDYYHTVARPYFSLDFSCYLWSVIPVGLNEPC